MSAPRRERPAASPESGCPAEAPGRVDWATGRQTPLRTCVGCRVRAPKSDLLRVVGVEVDGVRSAVPDPRGRLPGRGASVHPVPACLALAERRRAFPRALRCAGPLDLTPLRVYVTARAGSPEGDLPVR